MSRVAILLPVYNGEKHLEAAISSLLAQTYEDWRLIVCDDLSTDKSPSLIERFAHNDSRISFHRNEKNLGLFQNYNHCLRLSGVSSGSCEFVKPFAQDDVLGPEALARMVGVLDRDCDVALVSCARQWVSAEGKVTGTVEPFGEDRKIKGDDVIIYNLIQLTNWVGEPSTVLFRASCAGEGFDERLFHYGDIDYWFRIVANSNYYYLNEPLCGFRRHSESATGKNLSGLYFALDALLLGKKYRGYLEQLGETEEQFFRRVVELSALNVDHLVRGEGLTLEKVQSVKQRSDSLNEHGFRELAFHSLRYVTELLYRHSALEHRTAAEIDYLKQQLMDMKTSTSWKITAPLRSLSGGGRGV